MSSNTCLAWVSKGCIWLNSSFNQSQDIKIIGQASFSIIHVYYDELFTAMFEIKSVLNSWPPFYVSLDETLTPLHLLFGRTDHLYGESQSNTLTRLMHINEILDRFWKWWRWVELQESYCCHRGYINPSQVSVIGDLVIVHSADQPRGFLRLRSHSVMEVLVGRYKKI